MPFVDVKSALLQAGPLDLANAIASPCKLCGGPSRDFDLVDANKIASTAEPFRYGLAGHGVRFLRCEQCDLIFTTDYDDWSAADFARLIYNDDYVKIDREYVSVRPGRIAATFAKRLANHRDVRLLDYGSGAGVFENELRAAGFSHVASYDPFSHPARPAGQFDVITCYEVVEHSPDPTALFRDISSLLAPGGVIAVGTALQPENIDRIRGSWWYIAPRNGHVSFYSAATFATLAPRFNLTFVRGRNQQSLFFRTDSPPSVDLLNALADGSASGYERVRLCSPGASAATSRTIEAIAPEDSWHALETNGFGQRYRWSRRDTLEWRVRAAGATQFEILCEPLMAIQPAHLEQLAIRMDGQAVPVSQVDRRMTARVQVNEARDVRITIQTPPPVSPASLGRVDRRQLGIALPAET